MRYPVLFSLILIACGPTNVGSGEHAVDHNLQAIRGGTTDPNDPAVVALAVKDQGYYDQFCSGTLIGAKTVLTAAHCINAYGAGSFYYVLFGESAYQPTQKVHVAAQYANPKYKGDGFDFGLVQLDDVVTGITPIEINTTAMSPADIGKPIRHAGYGTTDGQNGSGIKRTITYNVRNVTNQLLESGATGKQTCGGDSGGPAFMTFDGSAVERVAGVVSFGDENCLDDGWDGRVDIEAAWIKGTMATWEVPTCLDDGACVPGCMPIDPDCACVADGQCTADCLRPEKDPDCPANCGADGVCSTSTCPRPDPDCAGDGRICSQPSQCRGRQCVSDAQHPSTYCSAGCGGDSECPQGMECKDSVCHLPQLPERQPLETCTDADFCVQGRICNGPTGGVRRCVMPCNTQSNCSSDEVCEGGSSGQRYCRPPASQVSFDPPRVNRIEDQLGSADGCSTVGGTSLVTLLALCSGLRRRRR